MEQKQYNTPYVDESLGTGWFATDRESGEIKKDKNGNAFVQIVFKKDIKAGDRATLFRSANKKTDKSPDFRLLEGKKYGMG